MSTETYETISLTVPVTVQVNLTDMELREYLMQLEDPTSDQHFTDAQVADLRTRIARYPGGADWVAEWDRELAEWTAQLDADIDELEDNDSTRAVVEEMKAETAAELREWATRDGHK
jgi:DNA repair ATPase RecN